MISLPNDLLSNTRSIISLKLIYTNSFIDVASIIDKNALIEFMSQNGDLVIRNGNIYE